MTEKWI